MYNDNDIITFLNSYDYDIRKSHNARWIDQKCTPDVLWSISDFVINYVENVKEEFTVKDIWKSDYAKETISTTYSKPNTDEIKAENEYDKVFSQPLAMLCYANIIEDLNPGTRHLYKIKNRDVLDYIAKNDLNSYKFVYMYNEKVMRDSGIYDRFNDFFINQNKTYFNILKEEFIKLYHDYTPVKKDFEPKRIFTKVLNPLSCHYEKLGTESGHLSKTIITKSDLMYNQDNFRDIYKDKPKNITRKQWLEEHPEFDVRNGYFEQQMNHAKKLLKDFNDNNRKSLSELTMFNVEWKVDNVKATQLHHIFPKNEYPEIMHFIENMIVLTPNQHFGYAHPNNNTQMIDLASQKVLLIAKVSSIKHNFENENIIYNFTNLLNVLAVGFEKAEIMTIDNNDFDNVVFEINNYYNEIYRM